ncbi:MAG TPA: gamma-glutamyltransferase [Alphaproteobacteria bacterium]|nr:gamma-glutamyltransferase [Alphaproteobacteria bacterium]
MTVAVIAAIAALALSACSRGTATATAPANFAGGAVADEPQAARIGHIILENGGSAADAAAAMYFVLAVTLPNSAGLGGGGMCVVYDPVVNRTEALDFAARAPEEGGAVALPMNARGMFALQAKYGRLRWPQIVAPAESMARDGAPVSRALARELAALPATTFQDPGLRRLLTRADGSLLDEGDRLIQPELAGTLAALRLRGPGDLHGGPLGGRFVETTASIGGRIDIDDLRDAAPDWRASITLRWGDLALHFAPPPATSGLLEAQLWRVLEPRWRRAPEDERAHMFAAASLRVMAARDRWQRADLTVAGAIGELVSERRAETMMADYESGRRAAPAALRANPPQPPGRSPSTSFVVADNAGGAVACAVSLHRPFGAGQLLPGLGFVPASSPEADGIGPQVLAPVVGVRGTAGQLVFAASSSGGEAAAGALVHTMLRAMVDTRPLEEAMAAPRVHYSGIPDIALVERADGGLVPRGYRIETAPALGRVNAIHCPDGLTAAPGRCAFRADRRGFGYAAGNL